MDDLTALALRDRICDATDRIPTAAWPFFSQTISGEIVAGATTGTFTFEAERDTLLTDLSITVLDDADAALQADLDIEYCNVVYAEHTDTLEFQYCCSRKPIFLVGVRENKKLRFQITLAAVAPAGNANIRITVTGYQGRGCCP